MNTRQRQIDEYPAYLAGLHEFPIDRGEHRHGEHPACRALEIRHLVDGDRRSGRAFGAGRERILVLRATAADEQRRGEEDGRGAKADQKPDLVQMAMTPHWESALRNSAGASLGLRYISTATIPTTGRCGVDETDAGKPSTTQSATQ